MKPPTIYVTIHEVKYEDPAYFALDGDQLVVQFGDPLDAEFWERATDCDREHQEYPDTIEAVEALLLALRAEREVLGHRYTADQLGFSLNEHAVLRNWVEATRPEPGEYAIGSEYNPTGLVVESPTRVVVHDDLYITRRGGTDG